MQEMWCVDGVSAWGALGLLFVYQFDCVIYGNGVHTIVSCMRVTPPGTRECEDVAASTFLISLLRLAGFEGVGEAVSLSSPDSASGPKR